MLPHTFPARGVVQSTTLMPTQGSVHSPRPSRLRSHCVPMPLTVEEGGIDIEGAYFVMNSLDDAAAEEAADEASVEMVEFASSQTKDVRSSFAVTFVGAPNAAGVEYSRGRKYGSQPRPPSSSETFPLEESDIEGSGVKGAPQKQRPLQ